MPLAIVAIADGFLEEADIGTSSSRVAKLRRLYKMKAKTTGERSLCRSVIFGVLVVSMLRAF